MNETNTPETGSAGLTNDIEAPPPLPFWWPRNGAAGLRARHDFPPLLTMIRGVVSPGPEALTDR